MTNRPGIVGYYFKKYFLKSSGNYRVNYKAKKILDDKTVNFLGFFILLFEKSFLICHQNRSFKILPLLDFSVLNIHNTTSARI